MPLRLLVLLVVAPSARRGTAPLLVASFDIETYGSRGAGVFPDAEVEGAANHGALPSPYPYTSLRALQSQQQLQPCNERQHSSR